MGKYANIFKESAAGSAGFLTALSGALLIGMAIGIPGFILVARENKKPKSSRNMTLLVLGFILMILGAVIGLGFNTGGIINSIENQL
jgi:NhaP-type Na+/H+ or K+/H+ antiporter